jgi:hypothetical protein
VKHALSITGTGPACTGYKPDCITGTVNNSNMIRFSCLFEDFPKIVQDTAVAARLHERSMHLMHQQLGVAPTSETAGQSTEHYKYI